MTTTHIELLRHGLPEGDNCFRGRSDFDITSLGLEQMRSATDWISEIDIVITSHLKRCREFASIYSQLQNITMIEMPNFAEIDFGDWDGKPKQLIWDIDQQRLSQFWKDPWKHTPPNGESLECFERRIFNQWTELLQKYRGKRILLVTHSGVMKQILRFTLELPKNSSYLQRISLPYASRVSLSVYHDEDGKLWPQLNLV